MRIQAEKNGKRPSTAMRVRSPLERRACRTLRVLLKVSQIQEERVTKLKDAPLDGVEDEYDTSVPHIPLIPRQFVDGVRNDGIVRHAN